MLHGLALASRKQAQRARKCLGYETSSRYSTTTFLKGSSVLPRIWTWPYIATIGNILAASPKARLPSLSRESSPLLHQSIFILGEDVTFLFLRSRRTSLLLFQGQRALSPPVHSTMLQRAPPPLHHVRSDEAFGWLAW